MQLESPFSFTIFFRRINWLGYFVALALRRYWIIHPIHPIDLLFFLSQKSLIPLRRTTTNKALYIGVQN